MIKFARTCAVLASLATVSACVGGSPADDPAAKYTINRVSAAEVAIGNDSSTRSVNRNTRPGVVRQIVAANPGLDDAIQRNGIDLNDVVNVRVRPTNVVDVFMREG